jgi:phosphotransferase system enzyme I (PtsI)
MSMEFNGSSDLVSGRFEGFGVSPGIAIGEALVLESRIGQVLQMRLAQDELDHEVKRFDLAVRTARLQLRQVKDKVSREIGPSYAGVFDAQTLMLKDRAFSGEIRKLIREHRLNADWALQKTAQKFRQAFSQIEDPLIRERGHDIEDLQRRLQGILAGSGQQEDRPELNRDTIVVAHSISPSDTVQLHREHLIGFCTDLGGRTSHTAIIANALEIPAVVGLHDISRNVQSGQMVVVDGNRGVVYIDPPEELLEEYRAQRADYSRQQAEWLQVRDRLAVTTDGERVSLRANVELPEDLSSAARYGAEGVGLYRSEFLFLECSPSVPTEEDHYRTYRAIAEQTQPHGAVIRTLDLGGEKYFHDVLARDEANPVMGMRAVRFCLSRPDIFKAQLRGLLRASAHGDIQVMFPLISGVDELRRVLAVWNECRGELESEGAPMAENIPLGIMIEVPSAAAVADLLAREVDFFSVGTNDLIQYCLALDRGNEKLAYLYEPLHPAVLRTLDFVVRSAQAAGIGVSLCGEMAAEPRYLPVLLGLGFRDLSMNPVAIPAAKRMVSAVDAGRAREVVQKALNMPSTRDIAALVEELTPEFDWRIQGKVEGSPP